MTKALVTSPSLGESHTEPSCSEELVVRVVCCNECFVQLNGMKFPCVTLQFCTFCRMTQVYGNAGSGESRC
jgi:hypothetical protein